MRERRERRKNSEMKRTIVADMMTKEMTARYKRKTMRCAARRSLRWYGERVVRCRQLCFYIANANGSGVAAF